MSDPTLLPISAQTLGELDVGMFGRAIDNAIQTVIEDIVKRPCDAGGKTQVRKVKIELAFEPEVEFDSADRTVHLERIKLEPTCHGLLPPTRGGITDVRIVRHKATFNRDCPGNFNQRTLDYDEQEALDR